jgi:hypothetical protein
MTEITTTRPSLPAVYVPPVLDIGAEDVALPRVKVGQFMSAQVQDQSVKAGQIFTSSGEDDAEVIYDPEKKGAKGVLLHVISLTRGKSVSDGGELFTFAYDDPEAPANAWVTYNYVVCLPEIDTDLPFKWLFTRTAAPAAKQMNTVLKRNAALPPYALAFRVETKPKENAKGKYFVPRVTPAEAVAENVAATERLAQMIAGSSPERSAPAGASEPAI